MTGQPSSRLDQMQLVSPTRSQPPKLPIYNSDGIAQVTASSTSASTSPNNLKAPPLSDRVVMTDPAYSSAPASQDSVAAFSSFQKVAADASQTSPSDLSQSTHADRTSLASTPPTSWSNFSSQEQTSLRRSQPSPKASFAREINTHRVGSPARNENESTTSRSLSGSPIKVDVMPESVAGQKRTASGDIKSPIAGRRWSPKNGGAQGRSRATSIESNASRISELSQQLRTRLSYAMIKAQNGWESNTLEEIETLASQHGSPISSASTIHGGTPRSTFTSPRNDLPNFRRQWSDSSEDSTNHFSARAINGVNLSSMISSHPTSHSPPSSGFHRPSPESHRRLAPAAPINHNPSGPPSSRPRRINTDITTVPVNTLVPATPPNQRPSTKHRTPSMNAAREKDAIETLLFLSSPKNAGYSRPASSAAARTSAANSSLGSPLKAQFGQHSTTTSPPPHYNVEGIPPRQADFSLKTSTHTKLNGSHSHPNLDTNTNSSNPSYHYTSTYNYNPSPHGNSNLKTQPSRIPGYTDDAIDRMLDAMDDETDTMDDGDETEDDIAGGRSGESTISEDSGGGGSHIENEPGDWGRDKGGATMALSSGSGSGGGGGRGHDEHLGSNWNSSRSGGRLQTPTATYNERRK